MRNEAEHEEIRLEESLQRLVPALPLQQRLGKKNPRRASGEAPDGGHEAPRQMGNLGPRGNWSPGEGRDLRRGLGHDQSGNSRFEKPFTIAA